MSCCLPPYILFSLRSCVYAFVRSECVFATLTKTWLGVPPFSYKSSCPKLSSRSLLLSTSVSAPLLNLFPSTRGTRYSLCTQRFSVLCLSPPALSHSSLCVGVSFFQSASLLRSFGNSSFLALIREWIQFPFSIL